MVFHWLRNEGSGKRFFVNKGQAVWFGLAWPPAVCENNSWATVPSRGVGNNINTVIIIIIIILLC